MRLVTFALLILVGCAPPRATKPLAVDFDFAGPCGASPCADATVVIYKGSESADTGMVVFVPKCDAKVCDPDEIHVFTRDGREYVFSRDSGRLRMLAR